VVGRVKLHQKPWGVKNGKVNDIPAHLALLDPCHGEQCEPLQRGPAVGARPAQGRNAHLDGVSMVLGEGRRREGSRGGRRHHGYQRPLAAGEGVEGADQGAGEQSIDMAFGTRCLR
jgi:hypothetical protein